jgi:hypothetical protein
VTSIDKFSLDNIKQFANSIKKQLGVSLSKAHELTAKIHGFADWHELTIVSTQHPFDTRLRAASFSVRSSPGLSTSATVEDVLRVQERMSSTLGLSKESCEQINRIARGYIIDNLKIAPVFHQNVRDAPAFMPGR